MSSDCTEAYRGPCICGSGEVVIEFCTPDHPWPTKTKWFNHSVTCSRCRSEYHLIEQDSKFVFVRKSDVQEREALRDEYSRRCDDFLTWPETKEVLEQLETLLDDQPSIAACHRLLRSCKLTSESYSSFCRKWNGAAEWIENNVRVYNLGKVLELLDKHVSRIANEMVQLEKLREEQGESLPYIGEPLLDTSRYRGW